MYIPVITDIYGLIRHILWNSDGGTHNELVWLDKIFGWEE